MMIIHLALASDWDAARAAGEYRMSTVGATLDEVGFIHASTDEQLAGTFQRFYADVTEDLVVVTIDVERMRDAGTDVRFEGADDGELYPHIYGPIVPALVEEATRVTASDFALTLESPELHAPVSTFYGAYGAGATLRSVSVSFPATDVGSDMARGWLLDAVETAHRALVLYVGALDEHAQDLAAPAVVAAGTAVHHALDAVGLTHTRYTGGPVPSEDDVCFAHDDYVDDSDSWDEEFGQVDPTSVDQDPSSPDDEEIPVTIARGDTLAEGPWGAVLVQRVEVYSTGVEVALRWIIRRGDLDEDEWAIRYGVLRWLSLDRNGRQVFPIAPPVPYVVRGNSLDSHVDETMASGATVLWVTPAPTSENLVLMVPLPTLLDEPGQIVLDAAEITRAVERARTINGNLDVTGTDGSRAPGLREE